MAVKTYLQFYQELATDNYFERLALNPAAQFGTESEPFLGATLLPEMMRDENSYEETQVRYRTLPALDNTRYSPAQLQESGHLIGTFRVDLGHTDIAAQLTGEDHDGLVKLLSRDGGDIEAVASAIGWADRSLVRPHLIKNEIQRWEAIIKGSVTRKGSNGYMETVDYHKPAGHRPEVPGGTTGAPAGWFSKTYDLLSDIHAGINKLESLGFSVTGMYCDYETFNLVRGNDSIKEQAYMVTVNDSGQIQSRTGRLSREQVASVLRDESGNGNLNFQVYNLGYRTPTEFKRFINAGATDRLYFVLIANTGKDYSIDIGDQRTIDLGNTLGYYAIGRNVGQTAPGRTIHTEVSEKKPQGLYGEAYQTGLPVVTEPDAIYVIQVLRPTA